MTSLTRIKFQVFAAATRSMSVSAFLTRLGRRSRDFLHQPDPDTGTLATWSGLRDLDDAARYGVIAAYLKRLSAGGSVLDVGCAQGVLAEDIAPFMGRYLGIERDEACVTAARKLGLVNAEFRVADAHTFIPEEKFDAIVFNECLNYLRDPIGQLHRYVQNLTPSGVLITSMAAYRPSLRIISALRNAHQLLEQATVANETGITWIVQAMRPLRSLDASSSHARAMV